MSFFFWPCLCCMSFDLQLLITPLVSSNSSESLRLTLFDTTRHIVSTAKKLYDKKYSAYSTDLSNVESGVYTKTKSKDFML